MNDEKERDLLNVTADAVDKEEDDQQLTLSDDFKLQERWEEEWQGMPEFIQEDLEPTKTLFVHFEDLRDLEEFSKLVDQKITDKTKSIWFPKLDSIKPSSYVYTDES